MNAPAKMREGTQAKRPPRSREKSEGTKIMERRELSGFDPAALASLVQRQMLAPETAKSVLDELAENIRAARSAVVSASRKRKSRVQIPIKSLLEARPYICRRWFGERIGSQMLVGRSYYNRTFSRSAAEGFLAAAETARDNIRLTRKSLQQSLKLV